jgi:DNA-binding MarR family transcriptional regulator
MLTMEKDLETRLANDHHQAIKLWLRMLTCTNRITGKIRSRLRENFNTTLPRFDLLAQLERHPEGLKMSELSKRMMVTTGNITGITDQLEAEGLVRREVDPSDRRSFVVKLTPEGRRLFGEMAAVHEGWVIELFEGLSSEEKETLYALLGKLKQHLNGKEVR